MQRPHTPFEGSRDIGVAGIEDPFGWVGHTVADKLRVEAVVAEGGFGVVYRARHLGFDERVALKCLKLPGRLEGSERERFLEAFVAEGKLLHRLSRSNVGIVQALDVGAAVSPNGTWTPYLALEWLEGRSLEDDLRERAGRGERPRPFNEVMELIRSAAEALGAAHEQGVAHRDIKPANLFSTEVGGRRIVKVVDFGIAKVMNEVASRTRALAETGASLRAFTPQYGAPEQFDRAYGATGPWSDVFALALVLVELTTGRVALDGTDTMQLFISATNPARRPTPRALGLVVSDAVEEVFARALAVRPAERFAAVGPFWAALEAAHAATSASGGTSGRRSDPRLAATDLRSVEASTQLAAARVSPGYYGPPLPSPKRRIGLVPILLIIGGCLLSTCGVVAGILGVAITKENALVAPASTTTTATTSSSESLVRAPHDAVISDMAPEDEDFVDTRGGWGWGDRCFLHIKAGRLANAKAACERGLAMNPEPAARGALLYNMGFIAEKSGDVAGARQAYEDSLAVRPGNAIVQKALASLAPPSGSGLSLRSEMSRFSASSFISNGTEEHSPARAFDDDPKTAWNENADGPGKGEWVEVTFASDVTVDAIDLATGWNYVSPRDGDLFAANAHLRRVRLELSGGESIERDVGEFERSVRIDLGGRRTTRLRIVALEVYPGTRWQDLCVSDVKVLGRGPGK